MKYDFVVHPGADPSQINLLYEGQNPLKLLDDVSISIQTPLGSLKEEKPFTYEQEGDIEIKSSYRLTKISNNKTLLKFNLTRYDSSKRLIIDPQLYWYTFYGGNNVDDCFSTDTDEDGNIFVTGGTTSDNFPLLDPGGTAYFSDDYSTLPFAVDINVFATPGINFYEHGSLTSQAIDMIETERADSLYIINAPNSTVIDNVEDIINNLDNAGIDSNYSAVYWPWIQIRDTDNATQIYIPPTGEVLRNIALTDNVSYPWFAVAGYSRGLVKSIKASKKLTLDDRDVLYKARINPIATFSDTGTIIWGNKTLQVRESALDRINVRRLLLRARKLISAVAVRLLFDQNDDQVRNEFLRLVNPILESIKKERGLYDFRVTVSNAPEDLDANTLRGKIYIKPTRSLEFIDLEFIVTPTGASFDNI
jgi:hypothetical protein